MTNLYINGVAVVLPSGFSISVKQENAFSLKTVNILMTLSYLFKILLMPDYMDSLTV